MRKSKGSKIFGRTVFFIPIIISLLLVIIGLASFTPAQPGTLVVETFSSGRYSPPVQLRVPVTVGTITKTSPFNLSLSQADYNVTFGSIVWNTTPPPRSILISGGKTEFAVGTYDPVLMIVSVTQNGFNSTRVTALHGVTPVVWVNEGSSPVTLEITHIATLILNPSQNYTKIFPIQGVYNFDLRNSGINGTINSI